MDNHGWILIAGGYKTYKGAHSELFSLSLYIKLKESNFAPFTEIGYRPASKDDIGNVPGAYLDWKTENFHYALEINFVNGHYHLIFLSKKGYLFESIGVILTSLEFHLTSDYYLKNILTETDAITEVHNLANALSAVEITDYIAIIKPE